MKWILVILVYSGQLNAKPDVIPTGRTFASKEECSQAHAAMNKIPEDDRSDLSMFSSRVGYACFRIEAG